MLLLVRLILLSVVLVFGRGSAQATEQPPVIIGLDADMSAVAVEGGEAIKQGALLAIAEINVRGGVLGRPLQLKIMDHRGNPARGISNIKTLAEQPNLLAVLGGVHTPVALAELPTIHEHEVIYLGPWAAGTAIVDNGYAPNYVYRLSVRDEEAAKVMLKHASQRGFKTVGLVLERTGWGRSNLASLQQYSQDYGITISHVSWVNWRQKTFIEEIQAQTRANSDALITVVNAPEGVMIAKAVLQEQPNIPIISHWGLAGGSFASVLGSEKLQQLDLTILQTFSFHQKRQPAVAARVLQAYREKFDSQASADSIRAVVGLAHAYDLVQLIALAADQANSLSAPAVAEALENISGYAGLIKHYQQPFTRERHDALYADDYFMAVYNQQGGLTPFTMNTLAAGDGQ